LPKACKNRVEIDGTRQAHRRDGASLTRFLSWLSSEAPKGGLTEVSAAARLAEFRRPNEFFRGLLSDLRLYDRPLGAADVAALARL
jgi:Xaa-Pro aminopeptidase